LLSRWFDKKHGETPEASTPGLHGPRVPRHSGAWAVIRKRLIAEPGLRIIDSGFTSPVNINYLTSLGHSIHLVDLVHDAWTGDWLAGTDDEGNPIWDPERYLKSALDFGGRTYDLVLLWTVLDYLPEPLVVPLVSHLCPAMNPGGQVLALFHTRLKGEETAHCRFHVTPGDNLEIQAAEQFPIQRAFTNRSIERLFSGWSGHRQFLAKDSLSEVIMTR